MIGGTTYLFVAGNADNGVSVFSVAANGALTNVSNVTDSGALQLGGVSSLTTAVIGMTTYLFAGGAQDNGLSVFSVGSNGALTSVANVSDTATLNLGGVHALTTAAAGNGVKLLAAGSTDNGVSEFSLTGSSGLHVANDFVVNSTTQGRQDHPTVTALPDGHFAVAFVSAPFNDFSSILARMFNANGSAVANDFDTGTAVGGFFTGKPSLATLPAGHFVVTNMITTDGGAGRFFYGVNARLFNADGSAAGNLVTVKAGSSQVGIEPFNPTVATLPDGHFVITFETNNNFTSDYDIHARLFDASGGAAGVEFLVNSTTTNDQHNPTATALPDGRFIVTWYSNDSGNNDIRARLFNADGSAVGSDFLVNTTTAHDQLNPTVTALPDGHFVVTWQSNDNGTDYDIRARLFDANGNAAGNDFLVDTTTGHDQLNPTVTALPDGHFAVTWQSNDNGTDYDIRARFFNADGSAVDNDFRVNSTTANDQLSPTLATLPDGNVVVTWQSNDNGHDYDIRATLLTPDGPSGPLFDPPAGELSAFGVNQTWSSDNTYPRFAADVNGDGLSDIVGFASNGVTVALATGNGHFASPALTLGQFGTNQTWSSNDLYPRVLGDVNGDHMADIVGFGSNGVYVSLATGGGNFASATYELAAFDPAHTWSSNDTYPRFLADVNGDSLGDIVGFASNGVTVSLATGNGHFAAPTLELSYFGTNQTWTSENTYPRLLADVNGDHMADIVGFANTGVLVSLATGGGHFAPATFELALFGANQTWSGQDVYPRTLADVNGDGMADIVGFGSDGVYLAHASGDGHFEQPALALSGFSPAQTWSSNDLYPRVLGDVNGDHKADIVGFGSNGVFVAHSHDLFLV